VLFPGENGFPVIDAPSDEELATLSEPTDEFIDVELGNREQHENKKVFPDALRFFQISASREQGTDEKNKVFPKGESKMYQQKRPTTQCLNCQEEKEIHAHGLCINCYRADARAHQRAEDTQAANRHVRKERKRLLKAYSGIMTNCVEVGVTASDIKAIKKLLRDGGYVHTVAYLFEDVPAAEGCTSETEEDK
jgi:hypothetical protein